MAFFECNSLPIPDVSALWSKWLLTVTAVTDKVLNLNTNKRLWKNVERCEIEKYEVFYAGNSYIKIPIVG